MCATLKDFYSGRPIQQLWCLLVCLILIKIGRNEGLVYEEYVGDENKPSYLKLHEITSANDDLLGEKIEKEQFWNAGSSIAFSWTQYVVYVIVYSSNPIIMWLISCLIFILRLCTCVEGKKACHLQISLSFYLLAVILTHNLPF